MIKSKKKYLYCTSRDIQAVEKKSTVDGTPLTFNENVALIWDISCNLHVRFKNLL